MILEMPHSGLLLEVDARSYPTGDEAHAVWKDMHERYKRANFSLWRTTTPEGDLHLCVICAHPGTVTRLRGELGGEPFELDERSCRMFAARRLQMIADVPEGTEWLAQEATYEGGKRLDDLVR